jgi:hypothetical protein
MNNKKLGPTGKFPDGKLGEGDEGELQLAIGTKDGKVVLSFGRPVSWIGMPPKEARKLAVFMMARANEADTAEPFIRASGRVICEACGDTYAHHPSDMKQVDMDGHPFLKVRCDGRRLKL